MATPEFQDALKAVMGEAVDRRTAVMCEEAVWWRCHRRLNRRRRRAALRSAGPSSWP
ncbi:MAG: DUF488 family protein [Acidimicrobiales bacterium]